MKKKTLEMKKIPEITVTAMMKTNTWPHFTGASAGQDQDDNKR